METHPLGNRALVMTQLQLHSQPEHHTESDSNLLQANGEKLAFSLDSRFTRSKMFLLFTHTLGSLHTPYFVVIQVFTANNLFFPTVLDISWQEMENSTGKIINLLINNQIMLFNFYDTARFAKEFLIDVPLLPLNEKNIAADTTLTEVSAAAFINNIPCFN